MSQTILIVIIAVLVILVGALAFFLMRRRGNSSASQESALQAAQLSQAQEASARLLLQQMNEMSRVLDHKLSDNTKQLNEFAQVVDRKIAEQNKEMTQSVRLQFGDSQKLIDKFLQEMTQVTEKVTRVEETGKQMITFADQLQSLQDILKNPKQRGVLGEYYLETLLKNVLPPGQYQMQYPFKNGEIVDAVVFVKDRVIPIDSKFSLENYNRLVTERNEAERGKIEKLFINDLKLRIQETSKYIRPDEGTMDFAFMFIPHEAIYYDLLINKIGAVTEDTENLIQRAAGKYKVIIVSPTSFLAYLQTVLQGLKAMQIEEQAKDIVTRVSELGKHLKAYEEYHRKLGASLGTVVNHFNSTSKEFKRIDKDVYRITGQSQEIELLSLEKPELEE
jgi:DNA recombination protein RmuC